MQMPFGSDLDQLARDLADAFFQFRFSRLPTRAAQPVQFHIGLVGAVARQQFDIFDRQEQLGLGGIMQLEAIMRRAGHFQGLQADKAANAVLDMNHEIARRETRDLGDEIVEFAACLARAHQPIAQNVLFADDGDIAGLETGFHAEHRQHGFVARRRLHGAPGVDAGDVRELVIPQHARHAVARAFAPQRDHDFLALGLQGPHVRHHSFEHVDIAVGALGGEVAPLSRAGIDHAGAVVGHGEWRQARQRNLAEPFGPFLFGQIEPVGRQRLIDCAACRMLQRLAPRLVIIGYLFEALARGVLALRLDRDRRIAEIIEQRIHPLLE